MTHRGADGEANRERVREADREARNHEDLIRFYRAEVEGGRHLFDIWESGGSRGDSVTPSTYSAAYRQWMTEKLHRALGDTGGGLLSLGCGNAAVEAEVALRGHRVLAVDALPEAVAIARSKGLDAERGDIHRWEPAEPWSVIYLDGVLGHLLDPAHGLVPVLRRVRSWLTPHGVLVASNDAPRDDSPAQPAPGVHGFHWLSADHLRDEALRAGFGSAETEEYRYRRPISGERVRAVVTAHAAGRPTLPGPRGVAA
ncbi:class I SAM-dependent methyltransferase [Streptomyces triticirhizae]|uniref:Methyltransferase domain-containing protein n=1 Tax=Streptomyces triticirhizae TaxID=2483353 RepID=A0A3M2M7T8_9ACTN|nr:methyltransferase domain-containing protein [Streptomyces triticirhizae]RMI44615.1 methyltransferase domain-containing protein [Streptomyces triticirhizae]